MKTKLLRMFRRNFRIVPHLSGTGYVLLDKINDRFWPATTVSGYSYAYVINLGLELLLGDFTFYVLKARQKERFYKQQFLKYKKLL